MLINLVQVMTPMAVDDDNENSPFWLQKKSKQKWRCTLCHITATSEKDLNDHGQEKKKRKAKEASPKTQEVGKEYQMCRQQGRSLNIIVHFVSLKFAQKLCPKAIKMEKSTWLISRKVVAQILG